LPSYVCVSISIFWMKDCAGVLLVCSNGEGVRFNRLSQRTGIASIHQQSTCGWHNKADRWRNCDSRRIRLLVSSRPRAKRRAEETRAAAYLGSLLLIVATVSMAWCLFLQSKLLQATRRLLEKYGKVSLFFEIK
jgi:hypothetical protein